VPADLKSPAPGIKIQFPGFKVHYSTMVKIKHFFHIKIGCKFLKVTGWGIHVIRKGSLLCPIVSAVKFLLFVGMCMPVYTGEKE
jgi:hypothetical protein